MNKWLAALTAAGIGGLWLGVEAKRRRQQASVINEIELLCSLLQAKQHTCIIIERMHSGLSEELLAELDSTLALLTSVLMQMGQITGQIDLAVIERIASTRHNISVMSAKLRGS